MPQTGLCTNSPNRCFTAAARRPVTMAEPGAKCPECGAALRPARTGGLRRGEIAAGIAALFILLLAGSTVWLWLASEPEAPGTPVAGPPAPLPQEAAPAEPAMPAATAPPAVPARRTADLVLMADKRLAVRLAPALMRLWLNAEGATQVMEMRRAGPDLKPTADTDIGGHLHGERVSAAIRRAAGAEAVEAVETGEADLALVAGTPNDPPARNARLIARDALAVIVAPGSPISDLSLADLARIFGGRIRSEAPFGGPPGGFTLHALDDGAGSLVAFRRLALDDAPIASIRPETDSAALDKEVAGDRNAIGFLWLGDVQAARSIAVDGVLPSPDAVKSGAYRLALPIYLYAKAAAERPQAARFTALAASGAGADVVRETGFMPP
jgi:phosphate transport system substrate-binding protein